MKDIISRMKNLNTTELPKVSIKKLKDYAVIPHKGSPYSAGYDLHAAVPYDVVIRPHETIKVGTGLCIEIPNGFFGGIFARSGLATKCGLRPANCVGVCDSDYRGEYIVALHNDSDRVVTIHPNDRIAQLVILPYLDVEFTEVDTLSDTERGEGGFGSSGN